MKASRISYEVQYGKERSRRAIAKRVVATYMARAYEATVFNHQREAKTETEFTEFILSGHENWLEWVKSVFTETQLEFMFQTPSEHKRNAKPYRSSWYEVGANAAKEALTEMLLPLYHKVDYRQPTFCYR